MNDKNFQIKPFIIIAILMLPLWFFFTKKQKPSTDDAYREILCSDKDDIYMTIDGIYEKTDFLNFDTLTFKILSNSNNNLLAIGSMSQFLKAKKLSCKFKNNLTNKLVQLEALPPDSQWTAPYPKRLFPLLFNQLKPLPIQHYTIYKKPLMVVNHRQNTVKINMTFLIMLIQIISFKIG
jgi:hypothetical protein